MQGKSVIDTLLTKTMKNMHQDREQVLAALRLLEVTDLSTLRKTGKIQRVRGEIDEYRINTKHQWVRILMSVTGHGVVLLTGELKKRNDLDQADVAAAEKNLAHFKKQVTQGAYDLVPRRNQ